MDGWQILYEVFYVVLGIFALFCLYRGVALYLNERRVTKFMEREQKKAAQAREVAHWQKLEDAFRQCFPELRSRAVEEIPGKGK